VAEQYRQPYLESSCFIAWIKGEVVEKIDRKKIVQHILKLSEQGRFRIITSSWTLAEVHKRKSGPVLDEKEGNKILDFFEREFFDMVEVTRAIGEDAHRLARRYGLKPTDAVHLAAAVRAKSDVLLTFDPDLYNIKHPNIRIEAPEIIGQPSLF
jgi:predicted nucleic acid-binding protein